VYILNHAKSPKQPHREKKEEGRIVFTEASFTYDICQSLIDDLNKKKPTACSSSDGITILKQLNETAVFIRLITKRAKKNDINIKEGYSESERKAIHGKISRQALALFDSLTTLDRDVFHDWCIDGLFTTENKYNFIRAERLPDYATESKFYETIGALAKAAKHCAGKSVDELSGVSGNLDLTPGLDIALDAITAIYIELTNEAPTVTGPANQTRFEIFAHKCLNVMEFEDISDDALRHRIRNSNANFSKK
jgi:hypothetical protein